MLRPLKLIISNAGAALGQHRRYEQPSSLVQLPSVPFPGSAADSGLRASPIADVKTESAQQFDVAAEDFEDASSQGKAIIGALNRSTCSSVIVGRQDDAFETASADSAESRAVQALGTQAAVVEDMYRAIVARMEALAPALSADLAALAQQKRAVAELQDMIT